MTSLVSPRRFSGALTALITPFRDGEIDEPALRALVDRQIGGGIHGVVPCGTTGESVTLTDAEHDRVVEIVIEQCAGRVPVIAGVGSNDTRRTIERAHHARHAGADGVLVVVPYYNKPTQAGMRAHFLAVAEAVDLPIVLYNVPGRTGVNLTPDTVLGLASHPNIVAVKEASGNLDAASQIVLDAPDDFSVLSGDDSLTLPVMAIGGHGVVSVVSNIVPREVASLVTSAAVGDFLAARSRHAQLFELCRAMFIENNPTAVKAAAAMLGICGDEVRLPLVPLSGQSRAEVGRALSPWLGAESVAA